MLLTTRSSLLSTYPDCARRWAAIQFWPAGYGLRSTRRNVGAATGTAVHRGDEEMMNDFIRRGAPPPTAKAGVERALDSWLEQLRECEGDILYDKITADKDDAEWAVRAMTEAAYQLIEPGDAPVLIEAGLSARQGDVVVTSTVDAYMQSGRLKDRKTGRNKPTTYPQQGNYSRTLRAHGYNVSGLDFEFIPRRKNTQPVGEIISIDQAVAETLAMETVAHIERDVTAWEASGDPGVFQANPGSFLCSENYCPAFGSTWCHAWKLKPQKKDQK